VNPTRPLQVRVLREKLASVSQRVQDIYSPFEEGYEDAPVIVLDCFDGLLGVLDEFDRQLAKLDGKPGAVSGVSPSGKERGE
jgi:hypothetical protein